MPKKGTGKRQDGLDGKGNKTFQPDKVREIGQEELTKSSVLKVVINTFGERHLVDVRQWYSKKGEDDLLPGKGVSVSVNNIDSLIRLLKKAKARAIKAKLLEQPDDDQ